MWVLLGEFVDCPIVHPLRDHCKSPLIQYHPNQRQDVRVSEVSPNNRFSTRSLHKLSQTRTFRHKRFTYAENHTHIAIGVSSHNLHCDFAPLVITLEYLRVASVVHYHHLVFIEVWDTYGCWNQALVAAGLAEFVKQSGPLLGRYSIFFQPLIPALDYGG